MQQAKEEMNSLRECKLVKMGSRKEEEGSGTRGVHKVDRVFDEGS
jgi:hypothetical protein